MYYYEVKTGFRIRLVRRFDLRKDSEDVFMDTPVTDGDLLRCLFLHFDLVYSEE